MSLGFVFGNGNNGPKRGVGSYGKSSGRIPYLPPCTGGPQRGVNWDGERGYKIIPPTRPSTVQKPKPKTPRIIDPLQPHEGPKRGIGVGPGVSIIIPGLRRPPEGPKRGIGSMDIDMSEDAALCLRLVNEFRKKNKLPPLKFSKDLAEIAMPHNESMLLHKIPLGHDGFNARASKAGGYAAGENVGYCQGYSNPVETLVQGWIDSPPHRKNLLGNFTHLGVALSHRGDLWYGTQLFARY